MITIEGMEENATLTVTEAIRISELICSVSEERLPMLFEVLRKAGIYIKEEVE